MSLQDIAATAFRLHKEKRISRKELMRILQQCVNVVAIENGYADELGLPFPKAAQRVALVQEDEA